MLSSVGVRWWNDRRRRGLRLLADAYGLAPQQRAELPIVVEQATEVSHAFVTSRVAAGDPAYVRAWNEQGGWEHWNCARTWLVAQRETFTKALLD